MLFGVLLVFGLAAATPSYTPTECGILFDVRLGADVAHVELATASQTSFRISVSFLHRPVQLQTRMVVDGLLCATATLETTDTALGLRAPFGFVSIDTVSGTWTVDNEAGPIFTSSVFATRMAAGVNVTLGASTEAKFYGAGGGLGTVHTLYATASQPNVKNREFFTSHVWSSDGFGAFGVVSADHVPGQLTVYGASWASDVARHQLTYTFVGDQGDLYLFPSSSMAGGSQAYYSLIGVPPVPPRYAFGFVASRWGWRSRSYIESVLTQFRNGSYPLDAFICDFEWYTPEPDYSLPVSGSPTFNDFTYNPALFPSPGSQIPDYHTKFHVRFGGIRKPRLGNSNLLDMARNRSWLIPSSRNLNYSRADVRTWYGAQIAHFLTEGVDFWWNDEGETQYFTFFDWNAAQHNVSNSTLPGKRFFTINRSYSPGMQRLGGIVWTGDTPVSWAALKHTAGYLLNWGLAGAGYITCDIGGFDGLDDPPDLLVRWYQLGVFMPVMRVHSWLHDKAHFPFLYNPTAAAAMRKALDLRYALVPYYYSLAHRFSATGSLLMRPLALLYPSDPAVSDTTTEWMVGDLLAVPVLDLANIRFVYLPAGDWYDFNSSRTRTGPTTFGLTVALDTQLVFVRAGSIVPLAQSLQYTDQLPGGPLRVHIYPGRNATFTLVEDDGETMAYTREVVRHITFSWNDAARTLSWSAPRGPVDEHGFTSLQATAMLQPSPVVSKIAPIAAGGSIQF